MLYLQNLTYHPPVSPREILKDLSMHLEPQSLSLVTGASGSGKSTLLEILAGLVERTDGNIFWQEQELTPLHLQQLAGLVFQFPERHFCGSTMLEELRLGHPELDPAQIREALGAVGLAQVDWQTSPHVLSGGQQRRLALAVQLVRQPYILLLDEPMAGLDWSMRRQLVQLLGQLKSRWTLLVVSHDAEELAEVADQHWHLKDRQVGRV